MREEQLEVGLLAQFHSFAGLVIAQEPDAAIGCKKDLAVPRQSRDLQIAKQNDANPVQNIGCGESQEPAIRLFSRQTPLPNEAVYEKRADSRPLGGQPAAAHTIQHQKW